MGKFSLICTSFAIAEDSLDAISANNEQNRDEPEAGTSEGHVSPFQSGQCVTKVTNYLTKPVQMDYRKFCLCRVESRVEKTGIGPVTSTSQVKPCTNQHCAQSLFSHATTP